MDFWRKLGSRNRRVLIIAVVALLIGGGLMVNSKINSKTSAQPIASQTTNPNSAIYALAKLEVKPAGSHDGYSRDKFGSGWELVGNCDMREQILNRDLTNTKDVSPDDCTVLSGTFSDPYTGKTFQFTRGPGTSSLVQIDHIVAISNAWQTGASGMSIEQREKLYNDPLELLAVSGTANDDKGASDASDWLPPNKSYDCRYVARQIAVKQKYHLWVTNTEQAAMQHVLDTCPGQLLPIEN